MVQVAYKVVKLVSVAVYINSVKISDLIKWNCTPRHLDLSTLLMFPGALTFACS